MTINKRLFLSNILMIVVPAIGSRNFASADATRAVCPGPDQGTFQESSLDLQTFSLAFLNGWSRDLSDSFNAVVLTAPLWKTLEIQIGGIRLNTEIHWVYVDEREVELKNKEQEMLLSFLLNVGYCVQQEETIRGNIGTGGDG